MVSKRKMVLSGGALLAILLVCGIFVVQQSSLRIAEAKCEIPNEILEGSTREVSFGELFPKADAVLVLPSYYSAQKGLRELQASKEYSGRLPSNDTEATALQDGQVSLLEFRNGELVNYYLIPESDPKDGPVLLIDSLSKPCYLSGEDLSKKYPVVLNASGDLVVKYGK
jgi:hypothetical protein